MSFTTSDGTQLTEAWADSFRKDLAELERDLRALRSFERTARATSEARYRTWQAEVEKLEIRITLIKRNLAEYDDAVALIKAATSAA